LIYKAPCSCRGTGGTGKLAVSSIEQVSF